MIIESGLLQKLKIVLKLKYKSQIALTNVHDGLQADYDFSRGVQLALENGRPLAVCPGTAAWSSLSG